MSYYILHASSNKLQHKHFHAFSQVANQSHLEGVCYCQFSHESSAAGRRLTGPERELCRTQEEEEEMEEYDLSWVEKTESLTYSTVVMLSKLYIWCGTNNLHSNLISCGTEAHCRCFYSSLISFNSLEIALNIDSLLRNDTEFRAIACEFIIRGDFSISLHFQLHSYSDLLM